MKSFIALSILLLSLPAMARQLTGAEKVHVKAEARRQVRLLKAEIRSGNLDALAQRSDAAIQAMVARGVKELAIRGDEVYAAQAQSEYETKFRGYLTRMVRSRDIGDHKPLVEWLDSFYERLEFVLGVELCKATHLSDLYTLNHCIPVVFHPCTFPMDAVGGDRESEYQRHFAKGSVYYGLVPVVTYWALDIGCVAATQGAGTIWLCGPIAGAGEYLMATFVAPKLSNAVYEHVCGG